MDIKIIVTIVVLSTIFLLLTVFMIFVNLRINKLEKKLNNRCEKSSDQKI